MWLTSVRRTLSLTLKSRSQRPARRPRPGQSFTPEVLEDRTVPAVVDVGQVLPTTISGLTPHTWTADSTGLYHTATDLKAEWSGFYQQMLAGKGASLTPIQRLEGNAEAVFENTGLSTLSATQQEVDREDVQREFDAIAAAMGINQNAGPNPIDPTKPLTEQTYLAMEKSLQSNPVLDELGVQGHGLNSPPASRYAGYTNDFQNNVDNTTRYIGGGLNNNQKAIADFFDDNILSHAPFSVVWSNGHLEQLNQNGNKENTLEQAVVALDDSMYGRVYKSTDFSATASTANDHYVSPFHKLVESTEIRVNQPPANGSLVTAWGAAPTSITSTPHAWVADAAGKYHTATDLTAEWKALYQKVLAGQGFGLTPVQHLEANAEAVFENTGLSTLSAAQQEIDREDAQREFDAIAAGMAVNQQTLGIDPTRPLTPQTYLALEQTIQNDPGLEELAVQGHGLNHPPASRYAGYTNDFQNNVDNTTRYVGGGLNNNQKALADFFDDSIMTHMPYPVVWQNGHLEQLNQNGNAENRLSQAVSAMNQSMFFRFYTSDDFKA